MTFLVPVSSVLFGALLLAEPVGWRGVAGMALTGLGLLCIDGRLLRWTRSVEAA